jgi:anti-sigma-K factor RskA
LKGRLLAQVRSAPKPTWVEPKQPLWRQLTSLWKRAAPAWGAVAVILIVALGVANLLLRQQANDTQVESGGMRILTLYGTDSAPNATGTLVISVDGEYGTLIVDRLPALDDAHAYQLWLIRDSRRTDGGVFTVSDEGYGGLQISSPEPLSSYQEFGITVEPAGGSPGPTGDKVLGGSL